jgi:hypothetical protein
MLPIGERTPDRPVRVLIEHPGSLVRLELTEELRAAGYEVTTCPGPVAPAPRACPLLADGPCPLVDDADVIVNGLHAEQNAILERQRRVAPETPVLLLAGAEVSTGPAPAADGVVPAGDLLSGTEVVAVVDALVRGNTDE